MNHELVREMPLFAGVHPRHHARVAALADVVDVAAGTVLVRAGRSPRGFFVVLDGVAEVQRAGAAAVHLGPGDFFGEIGLLRVAAATATVVAETPMTLAVMAAREFRSAYAAFPSVAAVVDEALAARVGA